MDCKIDNTSGECDKDCHFYNEDYDENCSIAVVLEKIEFIKEYLSNIKTELFNAK